MPSQCKQFHLINAIVILELQRIAESYFQHTESTFSSDTHQSMKRQIIAKHLTEPPMFGYYPTFHTLTSVGRKSTFSMLKI